MSGLETRGLRRSHPGAGGERREVLRGVDLRLEPGENVALIGRSGCGKTTLLRALLLLDSPGPEDAGEILLDGEPVRRDGARVLRAFRRAVQYVPQDAAATLHPRRSVLAQVSTPLRTLGVVRDREEAASRARRVLESLEIHREIWENRPHEISGGQVVRHHQQGWGGHGAGTSWGGHGAGTSRGGHGAGTSRGGLRLATHAGLCGGLLLIAGGGVGGGLDVRKQVEGLAAQGGVEPGDRLVEQEAMAAAPAPTPRAARTWRRVTAGLGMDMDTPSGRCRGVSSRGVSGREVVSRWRSAGWARRCAGRGWPCAWA